VADGCCPRVRGRGLAFGLRAAKAAHEAHDRALERLLLGKPECEQRVHSPSISRRRSSGLPFLGDTGRPLARGAEPGAACPGAYPSLVTSRGQAGWLLRGRPPRRLLGPALALVVFLWAWIFLGHWIYGRNAAVATQNHDSVVYQGYGVAMRDGEVPYRDFTVVYPPGSLPVFLAPTYAVSTADVSGYERWFARLMAGCGLLCLVLVIASRAPALGVAFVAVSPLLVGSLLLSRYDLWPAALVAGATAALVRDRAGLGFAALAAAVAAKLFALVLVPVAIVWTLRRRGPAALRRGLASFAAVIAAAFVPFLILAPSGLWASLRGQAARAIQIESLVGTALLTFGHPSEFDSLGAKSIVGHHDAVIATTVVEVAVLVALWIAFARGEMVVERLYRYLAACVCAFIALGKVFSPQYLIWLIPLVPLVRGRRGLFAMSLLAVAMVVTQWYFPERYGSIEDGQLSWLAFGRDLVLLVVLATLSLPRLATVRHAAAARERSAGTRTG
jgi:hypothetical protein